MAMKNYAKQLNAQIEEVVAEVKKQFFYIQRIFIECFLPIYVDSKSIGQ